MAATGKAQAKCTPTGTELLPSEIGTPHSAANQPIRITSDARRDAGAAEVAGQAHRHAAIQRAIGICDQAILRRNAAISSGFIATTCCGSE